MMDRKHVISGLFWLAVSLLVAVMAIDLGIGTFSKPGSGFIFFWSSVGLGVLSVILIIKSILRKGEATPLMDLWKGLTWGNAVLAIGILFLYALILEKLGFVLSTFMLMIVLFGIGRSSYRVVIFSALITTILSFIIFRHFLEVHFPRGIIGW
jgi:putative tricarboxylic transport membrane protein